MIPVVPGLRRLLLILEKYLVQEVHILPAMEFRRGPGKLPTKPGLGYGIIMMRFLAGENHLRGQRPDMLTPTWILLGRRLTLQPNRMYSFQI